jgi:hypothetical protein
MPLCGWPRCAARTRRSTRRGDGLCHFDFSARDLTRRLSESRIRPCVVCRQRTTAIVAMETSITFGPPPLQCRRRGFSFVRRRAAELTRKTKSFWRRAAGTTLAHCFCKQATARGQPPCPAVARQLGRPPSCELPFLFNLRSGALVFPPGPRAVLRCKRRAFEAPRMRLLESAPSRAL